MQWSEERFEEIKQQMTQFLSMAGFLQKNISFIPCSGLTGENIVHKPADTLMPWYNGPTLVGELGLSFTLYSHYQYLLTKSVLCTETAKPVAKAIEKPLRMTITDVYRGGIINPVSISGRIEIGNLQVGDVIVAIPSGENATIKGIEVDNEVAEWAVAGNNVQLHLTGIDMIHLK